MYSNPEIRNSGSSLGFHSPEALLSSPKTLTNPLAIFIVSSAVHFPGLGLTKSSGDQGHRSKLASSPGLNGAVGILSDSSSFFTILSPLFN